MKNLTDKKSVLFVLIFLCAFCWGASFVVMNVLLEELEVFEVLAARWFIAALFLTILALLKVIKIDLKGKSLLPLALTGLCQPVVYSVFEILGLKYTTASESSIIIATIPIMTIIIGIVIFHNKPKMKAVIAIIIAFGGIAVSVLFSPGFTAGGGKLMGYAYLAGAVIAAGFYSYASSKASKDFSPIEVTYGMAILAMIAFNGVNFALGNGFNGYIKCLSNLKMLGSILFLGILCSCFCYIVFNLVIKKVKPIIATNVVANSTTALGVILGCLIAKDPFGWFTVVGLIMTISGVVLASTVDAES